MSDILIDNKWRDKLLAHIDAGNVMSQDHPTEPLSIYNYTNKCQYDKVWDEVTLACRGLILGEDYQLVSRPFGKFFNMSELQPEQIPNLPYEVFEKYDGSCLISYWCNGLLYWASRGSFTSDQAKWANEIWREKYPKGDLILRRSYTYVAELIHPDNRIVVDYRDMKDIVFTAAIHTETGAEKPLNDLPSWLTKAKEYAPAPIQWLAKSEIENAEGFVVKFENNFRMKIKFEEYIRLHRIVTNITSYDIWETMKAGKSLEEILDRVPDEFMEWVRNTEKSLKNAFDTKREEAYKQYYDVILSPECSKYPEDRKVFAEQANKQKYAGLVFGIRDCKNIDHKLWDMVKPKFEKAFTNEYKDNQGAGTVSLIERNREESNRLHALWNKQGLI